MLVILRHPEAGAVDSREKLACISSSLEFLKVSSASQLLFATSEAVRKRAEQKGLKLSTLGGPDQVLIGGVEFLFQDLSFSPSSQTADRERLFAAVIKNRMLIFSLSYQRPEQLRELTELLFRIKFDQPNR